jgi:Ca2+-binding EF-hand superfamily protein
LLTLVEAFAFLDTDHDGLVSVDEIAAQMQSVMRVAIPADEIRSICKVLHLRRT